VELVGGFQNILKRRFGLVSRLGCRKLSIIQNLRIDTKYKIWVLEKNTFVVVV
jgi:hypothetical protein